MEPILNLSFSRLILVAGLSLGVAHRVAAQTPGRPPISKWTFTLGVGGFIEGNGHAITGWLSHNAYGASEPRRCTFDPLFRAICDDPQAYPKSKDTSPFGTIASVRRNFSRTTALELLMSTEQSGIVTGRCDDLASPRDPRCTDRFLEVSFGGASASLLAEVSRGWVHVGAGPALFFANWDMTPSHLAGFWLDATVERDPIPVFLRGQYRYYMSTALESVPGFSGFHPSTLFFGLGLRTRANNGGP
jgi:hypothetical protein